MCVVTKIPDLISPKMATPNVVKSDPLADADKTAAEAQAKANAETATRRTTRRMSALSTGAGLAPASALGAGKTTLGG
jgi:hypothetical protein